MSVAIDTGREEIRQRQRDGLNDLLRKLAAGNSFYRPILRKAGLQAGVKRLEDFFARMPTTSKAAIAADQRKHPPFGSNLTYPLERYCRFHQTSATTGEPIRWLDTAESWQNLVDNWKRVLGCSGVSATSRVYFAFSFGPFLGFWTAFEAASQMGCLCLPGGGLSSLARLEAMRANRADVLLCTPTYAMRLAEVAVESGIDPGQMQIRKIVVAGEPGGSVPEVRAALERRWPGAAVFDHHGMTEVGPVSYQCPEKPGTLMVLEPAYLAEILDPETGEPVERGTAGELVLTTLCRAASPLIRYRTGDLVREDREVAERFGRHEMALEGGILGRVDDMVLVRGVNVYPSAIEAILRSVYGVAEYRVRLDERQGMVEMQVDVEPAKDVADPENLAGRVTERLRTQLGLRVSVTCCQPGTLPRFEMKACRWVRQ